ncbi:hypothetical protein JCM9140_4398 [Halalkalibacter wakoensis JCM 9140]|uniref:O-antigen ligase-related domain-containing protein n=1 Tax=Halalkalibacter wakoensis JCM 9140 TaxID=1236970 RepID=W4Q887_9BACI|nr:O-antigen ligase family protein [Halalkalibacter wakoensis]GAE28190.1 hypothetical protein JCM9140_4398 [Halalkalibacter wakoensis JCM 9140]
MKLKLNNKSSFSEKTSFVVIIILMLAIFAFPGDTILMLLSPLLFILVLLIQKLLGSGINLNFYVIWGFLFALLCLSSVFWAQSTELALQDSIKVIQIIIICSLLSMWVDNEQKVFAVLNVIIVSNLIMLLRILMDYPFWEMVANKRAHILGLQVNTISMKFTLSTILCLFLFSIKKGKVKIFYIISILLFLTSILFLGSRRSFVIGLISLFVYGVLNSKNLRKTFSTLGIASIVSFILSYLIINVPELYGIIGYRLEQSVTNFLNGQSLDSTRESLVEIGINLFKEKPILGWGTGNYSFVSGTGLYSHNNFIELLSSLGIIGLIMFYIFYIIFIYNIFKLPKYIKPFMYTLTISLLLSDLAAPSYSVLYIHVFFAILVGYQLSLKRKMWPREIK